jgi:hypothetical protein
MSSPSPVLPPTQVHLPPPRHALGLPAGSVRALLAFSVLGLLWAILLIDIRQHGAEGQVKLPLSFIYLQYLMILILAHFFTAHGHTIGSHVSPRSPLGLPRGSIRLLLLAGFGGLAYYVYRIQAEYETPPQGALPFLLLLLVSAYVLGHFLTRLITGMAGGQIPYWYQDIQAWLALMAMIIMGIMMLIHLINSSLPGEEKIDVPQVEAVLAAIVGFYFGARS